MLRIVMVSVFDLRPSISPKLKPLYLTANKAVKYKVNKKVDNSVEKVRRHSLHKDGVLAVSLFLNGLLGTKRPLERGISFLFGELYSQ